MKTDIKNNHSIIVRFVVNRKSEIKSCVATSTYESEESEFDRIVGAL